MWHSAGRTYVGAWTTLSQEQTLRPAFRTLSLARGFATGIFVGIVGAATVPVILAIVAALACYIPARRAARVDPLEALRYE